MQLQFDGKEGSSAFVSCTCWLSPPYAARAPPTLRVSATRLREERRERDWKIKSRRRGVEALSRGQFANGAASSSHTRRGPLAVSQNAARRPRAYVHRRRRRARQTDASFAPGRKRQRPRDESGFCQRRKRSDLRFGEKLCYAHRNVAQSLSLGGGRGLCAPFNERKTSPASTNTRPRRRAGHSEREDSPRREKTALYERCCGVCTPERSERVPCAREGVPIG